MKLLICCAFIVCVPALTQSQGLPDSVNRQLKAGVTGFSERYHAPAMVVAVVDSSGIIFSEAKGFVDLESRLPATTESPFPILSITKLFTATMYVQLVERGTLQLDEELRDCLPEFSVRDSSTGKSGISLLQLATHTSGLTRNSHADWQFARQVDEWMINRKKIRALTPATKQELLHSLPFIKQEYAAFKLLPYQDRLYSNLGYCMLGMAAERAAGEEYSSYVRKNIFRPLGMNSSGFDIDSMVPVVAKGYLYENSSKRWEHTPAFESNGAVYAGGMYSTVLDLARFIHFQFDTSKAIAMVLSTTNRAMMASLRIGWKTDYPFVLHEGAMLGYRSILVYNPELRIGWVILTNTSDIDFSRINRYFSELLVPIYSPKHADSMERFAGKYRLDGGVDSIKLSWEDGKLFSSYLEGSIPRVALIPTGPNRLSGAGRDSYTIGYEFVADTNGRIRFLNLGQLKWTKVD